MLGHWRLLTYKKENQWSRVWGLNLCKEIPCTALQDTRFKFSGKPTAIPQSASSAWQSTIERTWHNSTHPYPSPAVTQVRNKMEGANSDFIVLLQRLTFFFEKALSAKVTGQRVSVMWRYRHSVTTLQIFLSLAGLWSRCRGSYKVQI